MNETAKQVNWDAINCLIVDDDKFSRTFVKTALYQIGIKNTKEASTTQEAAEILRSYKIHVVLLDQQMPEQSGLELARNIKEGTIGDDKNLPIIMVTIDTKEKTVMDAKNIGIHEYLVKPISPLALKKRICTALGIKERA
ncbi:MAG: response regulator [bacterium]|nr:response regulator [bacterium]MDY2831040.1 response regulator [Alphaproteobacteria bacterium]